MMLAIVVKVSTPLALHLPQILQQPTDRCDIPGADPGLGCAPLLCHYAPLRQHQPFGEVLSQRVDVRQILPDAPQLTAYLLEPLLMFQEHLNDENLVPAFLCACVAQVEYLSVASFIAIDGILKKCVLKIRLRSVT